MRKLRRSIARAKMQKEGIQHINRCPMIINPVTKLPQKGKSYFAEHWREYA